MIATFTTALVIPNDQKWTTDGFRFWRGAGRSTPLTITDYDAYIRAPGGAAIPLTFEIVENELVPAMTAEAMAAIPARADYELELQITDDVADVRQIRGPVTIKAAV